MEMNLLVFMLIRLVKSIFSFETIKKKKEKKEKKCLRFQLLTLVPRLKAWRMVAENLEINR